MGITPERHASHVDVESANRRRRQQVSLGLSLRKRAEEKLNLLQFAAGRVTYQVKNAIQMRKGESTVVSRQ